MKELFEQVIALKNYDLKALLANIDQYHIEGRLTDEERQELTQKARDGAAQEYDYKGEIDALWAAVRALQRASLRPPRTNGRNTSSPPARARRIRWATR